MDEEEDEEEVPKEDLMGYYRYHQHQEKQQQYPQQQYPQQHNHQQHNQPRQQLYQNYINNGHISKIPIHIQRPPNKFSPQYAAYVGAKPRAQASARVGLGGVY